MNEVFGVFQVRLWQRDFRPAEIFHDLLEARKFAAKLTAEEKDPDMTWQVYRRSATDWVKMSDMSLNG